MNPKIKNILQDLYKIDPSLNTKEEELIKIINKFLESRPDTKFDKNFAKRLRGELLSKFSSVQPKSAAWENILNFMSAKKFVYAAGGSLIAASLIIAVAVMLSGQNGQSLNLTFKSTTEEKGVNAFGKLAFDASAPPVAQEATLGVGGGGNVAMMTPRVASDNSATAVGTVKEGSSIAMPSPYYANYNYKYNGEAVDISGVDLPVLKRNKTSDAASKVGNILGRYNFGSVDLSRFSNLQANNISLVEKSSDGYSIYFNLLDGQVSIDKSQQRYATMSSGVATKGVAMDIAIAPERPIQNLTEADVPADDELISIANKFLDKYKIDKSIYGAPEIDSSWKSQLTMMKAEGQTIYAPQFISVLYPLQINGTPVYEEYGSRSGLYVAIDIRSKVVQSVNNLYTQNYSSSKYDLESDFSRIVKIAENGGMRGIYNYGSGDTKELELVAPKVIYIKKFTYINQTSEEMLIPGLMFEIKDAQTSGYYYGTTNVMVPLVKDMLNDLEKGGTSGGGPIRILPMSEPGAIGAPEPVKDGDGSSSGE